MKKSKEEANGWRDEHSKCVCVFVRVEGGADAEGKRNISLSVFTTELAVSSDGRTQISTDYHRIVKA